MKHILVVDDLLDNRGLLVQALRRKGYRTSEAANGMEALETIASDRPDLVLLDLMMPMMDGFEVLQRLQEQNGSFLPVIVVTAATERQSRLRALSLGAHEFLNKPVDLDEVLVRVSTLLSLKEARETSERKAGEMEQLVARRTRELAQSERQLRTIFEHAGMGILLVDFDLRPLRANPAAEDLLGYSEAELRDKTLDELVAPEDWPRVVESVRQIRSTGIPYSAERRYIRKDGRLVWLNANVAVIRAEDESARCFVGMLQDISARKQAEQELKHRTEELERANMELKQTDRYKDEFLAVVSHELRTPLNFITGFASILEDEIPGKLNEQQHDHVKKIIQGADRMIELVDNLLDMSRIQAGKFELHPSLVDYGALIRDSLASLEPLAAEKNIALDYDIRLQHEAWMDPQRIMQVLTNLVGNAIKFTPPEGHVRVLAFTEDDVVVTQVRDTGEGISADELPKVFQRFYQADMSSTRKAGGTGLGLSITKALIEAHGGQVGVMSCPGEGSTFWFTLPLAPIALSSRSQR